MVNVKRYVDINSIVEDEVCPTVQRQRNLPAGSNGEVQFNSNGAFGADPNFTWNNVTKSLGIGTSSPEASAVLDLSSTTKGFLIPRMTTTQRDAISSPATGLTIYNTTTSVMNTYNGSAWTSGGSGAVSSVFGRTGAVVAQSGDYDTSEVPENINLYFTDERAVSALTGQDISLFVNDAGYLTSAVQGSIEANQVAIGNGPDSIGGSDDLTFDGTTFQVASGKIIKGQYSNLAESAYINPDGSAVFADGNTVIDNAGKISVTGFKQTDNPTDGYVMTSDAAGNGTWQAGGGGGGSPGGSNTNIQLNDDGDFYGDDEFNYNKSTHRLAIQLDAEDAEAPFHADVKFGSTIAAPDSITIGPVVLDNSINSPASGSASQIDAPTDPNSLGLSFIYIDTPNGSVNTSMAAGASHIANGQTIQVDILVYRIVNGVYVTNPNFISGTYTDLLNDGSPFSVDSNGWGTPNSYLDGYLCRTYDPSSGVTTIVDISTNTSHDDSADSGELPFIASAYPSIGASWNFYVAQYILITGLYFKTAFQTTASSDANVSGAFLILSSSWSGLVNNGFIFGNSAFSQFQNVSTSTSYYDYGQTLNGDPAQLFSSYAFPYFDTSLSGSSSTITQIDYFTGSGALIADGSNYYVETWEYKTNSLNGIKYFVSSPDTSGTVSDDNSGNPLSFSGSMTPGNGDGRVVLLYKNGGLTGGLDIGNAASYSVLENQSPPSVSPAISSYSGILRNMSLYGYVTSPALKYSSTHNDYSVTDNNPVGGYMWLHSWSGFGNATSLKAIENSYRSGSFYSTATTASFLETNTGLSDSTVTPNTVGFLGNGWEHDYTVHSNKTVNGTSIYSPTGTAGSITLPNDGLYYTIPISYEAVSGATYKLKRIINGDAAEYKSLAPTSLTDDTSVSFGSSSTLTPTQSLGSTGILDQAGNDNIMPANLRLRNTGGHIFNKISFENNVGGGDYQTNAEFMVDASGNLCAIVGLTGSSGFVIKDDDYAPFINLKKGSGSNGSVFNSSGAAGIDFTFLATGGDVVFFSDSARSTAFFGKDSLPFDPSAAMVISPKNLSDLALVLTPHPDANAPNVLVRLKNYSETTFFELNGLGRASFGKSITNTSVVEVAQSTGLQTQILLTDSPTLPTIPIAGGVEYQSGSFFGTNNSAARRRFVQALATNTNAFYWRSDANGYPIADNTLQIVSNIILAANLLFEAKQGISLDAGKELSMGSASNMSLSSSTGTKFGTATSQKLSFWNKTTIVQPTTAITGAAFAASSGTTVNDASTFGGYTIKQIAAALVNVGLLA